MPPNHRGARGHGPPDQLSWAIVTERHLSVSPVALRRNWRRRVLLEQRLKSLPVPTAEQTARTT
jgi:hypothetical protein